MVRHGVVILLKRGSMASPFRMQSLFKNWKKKGYLTAFEKGAHLVITGGEPLLQQDLIVSLLEDLEIALEGLPYVEIETNATILPSEALSELVMQFNVSPKLANSGMSESKRVYPKVMQWFSRQEAISFKFVTSKPNDIEDIIRDFVEPFNLDPVQVYLMPAASDFETLRRLSAEIIELCKDTGFRFSSRLQVSVWDECVGR